MPEPIKQNATNQSNKPSIIFINQSINQSIMQRTHQPWNKSNPTYKYINQIKTTSNNTKSNNMKSYNEKSIIAHDIKLSYHTDKYINPTNNHANNQTTN